MFENNLKLQKIYLNCRRGILELDIILINFLKQEYVNMDTNLLNKFSLLLNESDNDLYAWLVKKVKPDYIKHKDIILIINKINNIFYNLS